MGIKNTTFVLSIHQLELPFATHRASLVACGKTWTFALIWQTKVVGSKLFGGGQQGHFHWENLLMSMENCGRDTEAKTRAQFHRAAKHKYLLSVIFFALIKLGLPTNFPHDFQVKQTTAEYL